MARGAQDAGRQARRYVEAARGIMQGLQGDWWLALYTNGRAQVEDHLLLYLGRCAAVPEAWVAKAPHAIAAARPGRLRQVVLVRYHRQRWVPEVEQVAGALAKLSEGLRRLEAETGRRGIRLRDVVTTDATGAVYSVRQSGQSRSKRQPSWVILSTMMIAHLITCL